MVLEVRDSDDTGEAPDVPDTDDSGEAPDVPDSNDDYPNNAKKSSCSSMVVWITIAGVLVVLVLLGALLFAYYKNKKKKRMHGDEPEAALQGPCGSSPPIGQDNLPAPADDVVKMPPMASLPPVFSSSGGSGSGSKLSGPDNPVPLPSAGLALGLSKRTFTIEELSIATDEFSDANVLGQGGFGYVHKGVLADGKEVAVKSLKSGSSQGDREFQAEVEIITRVHHKHLVSLVGYCIDRGRRMLVYEFVPNNTLQFHLHGKGRPTLDWPTRLKIALGAAEGLAYLHEDCQPKIIHRDIKATNILLDFSFEAKVADFGLAKFSSDGNTHVSTRVMGTFGYLAPEYASSGKLTAKSDVFSFGVMLIELITGLQPTSLDPTSACNSLVDWARPLLTQALEDGNFDSLVDPQLQKQYNLNEMTRMVACADACVRHSAYRRPKMKQVVRALESSLEVLNEGIPTGLSSSYGSSDPDSSLPNEEMKKFRKMALASQLYESSEYSGVASSEYGPSPSSSSSEHQNTSVMEILKMKKGIRGA